MLRFNPSPVRGVLRPLNGLSGRCRYGGERAGGILFQSSEGYVRTTLGRRNLGDKPWVGRLNLVKVNDDLSMERDVTYRTVGMIGEPTKKRKLNYGSSWGTTDEERHKRGAIQALRSGKRAISSEVSSLETDNEMFVTLTQAIEAGMARGVRVHNQNQL